MLQAAKPVPTAHSRSQLHRPAGAADRPRCELRACRRERGEPRLRGPVRRAHDGASRLGARPACRLLAFRLARQRRRHRLRRSARLSRPRSRDARHPALCRVDLVGAQVHVGGARHGAGEARHRRQVRPHRRFRARQRSRTAAPRRARMPSTTPRSAAPASCGSIRCGSCSMPPRSCLAGEVTAGPRLAIVTNGGGPAVLATDALVRSGGKLAELVRGLGAHSWKRPCPARPAGRIRSMSAAMRAPSAISRRSMWCSRIRVSMRCS